VPFGETAPDAVPAHHLAEILLPEGADRQAVRTELNERGIQTSVHYPPIHQFSAYRSSSKRPLPQTKAVAPRLRTLPLFGRMSDEQIDLVTESLLEAL
jgi:dTDP-4-amino-4,6-dideoxygalactose transaminase